MSSDVIKYFAIIYYIFVFVLLYQPASTDTGLNGDEAAIPTPEDHQRSSPPPSPLPTATTSDADAK